MTAPQRLTVSGQTLVIEEDATGIVLEGPVRLRPGREVDVLRSGATSPGSRRAVVWTWRVSAVGPDGAVYRGYCRWI